MLKNINMIILIKKKRDILISAAIVIFILDIIGVDRDVFHDDT